MQKHVKFPIINPQSWSAFLSNNRLWGNNRDWIQRSNSRPVRIPKFFLFPRVFSSLVSENNIFLKQQRIWWWFPIINQYRLHLYPWHEQHGRDWEKRGNKSCCFSQKSWVWTDSLALNMYLSHHTVSHSREAVAPEGAAPSLTKVGCSGWCLHHSCTSPSPCIHWQCAIQQESHS